MRIVRLEIFGFKSFVERFVLNLDTNVVGIVGPNGCGKSNVVDALRWVLGETNARQLRGGVLEDLIFNGSDSRRPLGMCEVSITLRNPANNPIDYAQRLKELAETEVDDFALPDVDIEGAVVKVNEAPAGEDTEAPVEPKRRYVARSNSLTDIPGLFDATEVQLTRRLYRSGESEYFINRVACRLSDMVEFYRLIGLGARGLSIVQQGQISQIITRKPVERRELLEEAAGISGFRARIEVAERKFEKTEQNLLRLSDVLTEVEKQVRTLKRQATRAEQRGELKARLKECELKLFKLKTAAIIHRVSNQESQAGTFSSEREEHEIQMSGVDAECERIRAELTQLDVSIVELRTERDRIGEILGQEKAKENALRIELTRREEKLKALTQRQQELAERKAKIAGEIILKKQNIVRLDAEHTDKAAQLKLLEEDLATFQNSVAVGDDLAAEFQTVNEQIAILTEATAAISQVQSEIKGLESKQTDSAQRERQCAKDLHKLELEQASMESEIASLSAQLNDLANAVRKEVGQAPDNTKNEVVLAACFHVPEDMQRAVQAVLGEYANFLVVADQENYVSSYLARRVGEKQEAKSRIGFIDSQAVSSAPQDMTALERTALAQPRMLLECIDVQKGYEALAQAVLGNVVFIADLEAAISFQKERRASQAPALIAVTAHGEVVTAWGWFTTVGQGLTLSFTRRIEQRNQDLAALSAQIGQSRQASANLEAELSSLTDDLNERRESLKGLYAQQRTLSELKEQLRQKERELEQRRMQEERRRQQALRGCSNELELLASRVESERRRIEELHAETERLEGELHELNNTRSGVNSEFENLQTQLRHLSESAQSSDGALAKLYAQYGQVQGQLRDLETKRDWLVGELAHASQKVDEIRRKRDALDRSENNLKLEIERGRLEVQMLWEEIERYYPGEVAIPNELESEQLLSAVSGDAAEEISALHDEGKTLRARIEREGEVDPTSIELYSQEKARFDNLSLQYQDLVSAKKLLEQTISELKAVSRARFIETFDFVSKKFEELVPLLFNGGSGRLELINPNDPLMSGVEIGVRPPGKKLKTLELMSGGEKALAATALLFSVFLFKPSPICVLDEVDAPLDEANLERFLDLVREIAHDTQFLIITHNKQTMAAVDKLVGITMQEKGVTTALAVTFEQYESGAAVASA